MFLFPRLCVSRISRISFCHLTTHRRSLTTMKAVQLHNYGPPGDALRLVDIEIPAVEPHQVLVRVHALSINPLDCDVRRGYARSIMSLCRPLPAILGQDASG